MTFRQSDVGLKRNKLFLMETLLALSAAHARPRELSTPGSAWPHGSPTRGPKTAETKLAIMEKVGEGMYTSSTVVGASVDLVQSMLSYWPNSEATLKAQRKRVSRGS